MSNYNYCRSLITDVEVENFVDAVLNIKEPMKKRNAINLITNAERNINWYDVSTLNNMEFRDFEYRSKDKREELRTRILYDLIHRTRLVDDENICLNKGGAKPRTDLKAEYKLFYIIGPPASGKSTISNTIADKFGAYILDSDYVKRKLPEYKNQVGGASLIHDESDVLVFSYDHPNNLLAHCLKFGYNMVIPKIGYDIQATCNLCLTIKKRGYSIYLVSVDLDRAKATIRAYNRFKKTKRYVPLSLIFDYYGNDPILNYFRLKQRFSDIFEGFIQLSTDVGFGKQPILIEQINAEFIMDIYGGFEDERNVQKSKYGLCTVE